MTDAVTPVVRPDPASGGILRSFRVLIVLAAAATLLTVLVAASWAPLMALDGAVVQALNAAMAPRPWLLAAAEAVTGIGRSETVRLLTGVAVVVALLARSYRAAAYLLACYLVEYLVENGLKHLVGRERPVVLVELASASGGSYPSGHTMGTTVLVVSLAVLVVGLVGRRWWRPVVIGFAALVIAAVAASRVLLGVHFPSDVTGAVLLGVLLALALVPIAGLPRTSR